MKNSPSDIAPQLIELLAKTDALLAPCRCMPPVAVAGVVERREEYHRRGIPMFAGGGSGADRVAAHRQANEWERSGIVRFSRRKGVRAFWRLSDSEDWRLRFWAMLPGEPEMVFALQALRSHIAAGHTYRETSRSVPETALAGEPLTKATICGVEDVLAPAFSRGFADSQADTVGLIWYTLTEAGERFLDDWKAPVFKPPVKASSRIMNETGDAYVESLRAALVDRKAWRGEPGHVAIPLSCGFFPRKPPGCRPIVDAKGAPIGGADDGD
jgi:hypothetical protein